MKLILTEEQLKHLLIKERSAIGVVDKAALNASNGAVSTPDFTNNGNIESLPNSYNTANLSVNAKIIQKKLMTDLAWTDWQAAALVAICQSESNCNPAAVNKAEKSGRLKSSSANGSFDYGAGIIQWSHLDRKVNAVKFLCGNNIEQATSFIKTKGIESLSLEQQIEMIENELTRGNYSNLSNTVKKTETPMQALATLYCYYVGGSKNSTSPASIEQANAMAAKYSRVNNGSNGFMKRAKIMNSYLSK